MPATVSWKELTLCRIKFSKPFVNSELVNTFFRFILFAQTSWLKRSLDIWYNLKSVWWNKNRLQGLQFRKSGQREHFNPFYQLRQPVAIGGGCGRGLATGAHRQVPGLSYSDQDLKTHLLHVLYAHRFSLVSFLIQRTTGAQKLQQPRPHVPGK